jgi:hypothetical protein
MLIGIISLYYQLEFPSEPFLAGKKTDESSHLDVVEIVRIA